MATPDVTAILAAIAELRGLILASSVTQAQHTTDIKDHEDRLRALEARPRPLGPLKTVALVGGTGSAVLAVLAILDRLYA